MLPCCSPSQQAIARKMVPRKAGRGNVDRHDSLPIFDNRRTTFSARSSNMVFGVFGRINGFDWIDVSAASRNVSTFAIAFCAPLFCVPHRLGFAIFRPIHAEILRFI
jgi:hypothetical protein